jgi:L-galactose dehydrogenase
VVLTEVLPALAALQAAGLVKRIGITGYPLDALRYLADHCPPGVTIDTALSYCHFNLHDDTLVASGTLAHLAARGIGTIMGSPLSMGLLTARGPPPWHPASPELKARCAAAAAAAAARGADIAHLALHFALFSNPELPTILVGTASLERLAHDVEVAKGRHPLSEKDADTLAAVKREFFEGPDAERVRSWEGREVESYWVKVGKLERTKWTRERAKFPDAIKEPEGEHNHFAKK